MEEFFAALKAASSGTILVAAHEHPDGDAISSLSAAVSILNDNGFRAKALLPAPVADGYASFVPQEYVITSAAGVEASLCSILDTANLKRAALADYALEKCPCVVNVDHHPDNEKFGTMQIIDPEACSAAQIVFRIFRDKGFRISPENATRLLLGVLTDTGCFRFDNTKPNVLRAAADLLELGADHHKIILDVYSSKPENMVRFEAELVQNHLKTAFGGAFAWMVLERSLLERYQIDIRNTEQLIDIARNVAGVKFAATLRPEKDGYKISLRSKDPAYSAGRIARDLNGGGHEMAAGGFIPASSAEEAEKILLQHVEMELKRNEKQSQ